MAAQSEFPLDETRFGERCVAAMKAAKARGELTWDSTAQIIEAELAKVLPQDAEARAKRAKNKAGLFDALMAACELPTTGVSPDARRLVGVSLAQIQAASPGVDAAELKRRGAAYKRKYNAPLTPRALSLHWHEFPPPKRDPNKPDVYAEPPGWRARVLDLPYDAERLRELAAGTFHELPLTVREQICK